MQCLQITHIMQSGQMQQQDTESFLQPQGKKKKINSCALANEVSQRSSPDLHSPFGICMLAIGFDINKTLSVGPRRSPGHPM